MSLQIIEHNPNCIRDFPPHDDYLEVSEFYCDTIQGEGVTTGAPAAFLRLQNCTLSCRWCDSKSVWRWGNPFTFDELFKLMDNADLPRKLQERQHLILTGGSPLMQQEALIKFIDRLINTYPDFWPIWQQVAWLNQPIIEIENECVIMPESRIVEYVEVWNNSPKLCNSGVLRKYRYKPEVIKYTAELDNSWFKFVVYEEDDWDEIEEDFLEPGLIRKDQIILMPRGDDQETLAKYREWTINLAIRENVRYCTREHIVVWNKQTGV